VAAGTIALTAKAVCRRAAVTRGISRHAKTVSAAPESRHAGLSGMSTFARLMSAGHILIARLSSDIDQTDRLHAYRLVSMITLFDAVVRTHGKGMMVNTSTSFAQQCSPGAVGSAS